MYNIYNWANGIDYFLSLKVVCLLHLVIILYCLMYLCFCVFEMLLLVWRPAVSTDFECCVRVLPAEFIKKVVSVWTLCNCHISKLYFDHTQCYYLLSVYFSPWSIMSWDKILHFSLWSALISHSFTSFVPSVMVKASVSQPALWRQTAFIWQGERSLISHLLFSPVCF